MYAINFEYDGRLLSDYGFIICTFNGASGANTVDIGQKITFNKVSVSRGKRQSLIGVQYDNCIQSTYEICKNPNIYKDEDMDITAEEWRAITRWLSRPDFHKFRIFDYRNELAPCYYNATFNVSKINVGEVLRGIQLEMVTDRPFGLGEERVEVFDFQNTSQVWSLKDRSDEIGYTYPTTMKITCAEAGDLTIVNETTGTQTFIRGCSKGEVITFDGGALSISSSSANHDIYNDFNYDYFKIGNTFDNRINKITVSKRCKIEIRYSPIIKNIPQ